MSKNDDADHQRAVNKQLLAIIHAKDLLLTERDSEITRLIAERDYWRGEFKHLSRGKDAA